jgi:hypothetical protein
MKPAAAPPGGLDLPELPRNSSSYYHLKCLLTVARPCTSYSTLYAETGIDVQQFLCLTEMYAYQ